MMEGRHLPLFPVILLLLAGMSGALGVDSTAVSTPTISSIIRRAESAFSEGKMQEAEVLYTKASEATPGSAPLLVSLAAVKTRLGKNGDSDELLKRALKLDLGNSSAWLLLGMNALARNSDEEATADFMQAVVHDRRNARAHNYLGIAAGRREWGDVSEQELRKAVELDPAYADANFNLAVLYLGRTPPLAELARRHYQRALDLGTPRDPLVEGRLSKGSNAVANPPNSPSRSATLP